MAVIEEILGATALPRFAPAEQLRDSFDLDDTELRRRIRTEFVDRGLLGKFRPGWKVAITAGSRGIDRIALILKEVVLHLRLRGCLPFVVACMGSHGGDAAGQKKILARLGITEETVGAPVLAFDELVTVGRTADGRTVYADKFIREADAVVVLNRIKPHTAFRAPVESGLQKMLAVGLGKQKGADACHIKGFDGMYENVIAFAAVIMENLNVAAGLGILENPHGRVCDFRAVAGDEIRAGEPRLLEAARSLMPRLFLDDLDLLVVAEMGKDISGSGMDTNVIGRYPTPYISGGPRIAKIAVLDLTEASEGNAHGVGFADFIPRRLFDKIVSEKTYPNCLTNKVSSPAKIPPIMPNDLCAVKAAIKTCSNPEPERIRAVWIKNTHDLDRIYISEALLAEAADHPNLRILGPAREFVFSGEGLPPRDLWD